jgi:hypothetical protein
LSSCRPHTTACALAAVIFFAAAPGFAQDVQTGDAPPPNPVEVPPPADELPASAAANREVYLPDDFARYAPRTALDMIVRIPGFVINEGEGGRGLGQATGNLLINGDRIASKSVSTRDQLARIPRDNVIRVEVVDGATLDTPGLSGRVANIIVRQGGMSGQFEWNPQLSTGAADPDWLEANLSVSGTTGSVDYTLAFSNDSFVRGSAGPAIFTDAAGLVDRRLNVANTSRNQPTLSGRFGIDVGPDVVANINLTGGRVFFRAREEERRGADSQLPPFLERFRTTNDEWFYEIGGDIEFPLGSGRLKLIVLDSLETDDFVTTSLRDVGVLATSGSRFARDAKSGERIARSEYSWKRWGADWQFSAEAAFNRLDQTGILFGYDPLAEEFIEITLPGAVGGVREDRYESILSVGFPIAKAISLQFASGAEYSTISQTGASVLSRVFLRPKGSLRLAWAAANGLDVNLTLAREVGQLNFGDFLASVNLSDDVANAGNANLRPQQTWRTQLDVAKNFGSWGSAAVTIFEERIDDLVLFVPIGDGGEARGNIANANRYGVRLRGTLQLEPLGLTGGRLDMRLNAERSRLIDPVTQLERRMDVFNPFEIRADFRHDVPSTEYAWGFEFRDTAQALSFRIAETTLSYSNATFGAVFVEHKNVLGATVRLRVANVFDGNDVLARTVYAGPRGNAPVLFVEDRRRSNGQSFNLTVSGSF